MVSENGVYFLSSGYILIWLYPEKSSIRDILSKTHVSSIITSVMDNEKFIFKTGYVKIAEVNADSDLFILKNGHNVRNPMISL